MGAMGTGTSFRRQNGGGSILRLNTRSTERGGY
jgi:hypothetical protein